MSFEIGKYFTTNYFGNAVSPEKIHEVMCPSDDSHLTIKFKDFFIICPSIVYFSRNNEFTSNSLGEIGEEVTQGFEYNSGTNSEFLNIEEIKSYNQLSKY